jgi:hypothetical protein
MLKIFIFYLQEKAEEGEIRRLDSFAIYPPNSLSSCKLCLQVRRFDHQLLISATNNTCSLVCTCKQSISKNLGCLAGKGTQLLEFLGIILNSLSLAFMLPSVKGEKTHKLWVQALNHNRIKLRELAKVMEKFLLGHSGLAVRPDPLQESAVRTNLDGRNGGDFEKYLVLSEETKADLSWWIKSCIHQKEKLFFRANQI